MTRRNHCFAEVLEKEPVELRMKLSFQVMSVAESSWKKCRPSVVMRSRGVTGAGVGVAAIAATCSAKDIVVFVDVERAEGGRDSARLCEIFWVYVYLLNQSAERDLNLWSGFQCTPSVPQSTVQCAIGPSNGSVVYLMRRDSRCRKR